MKDDRLSSGALSLARCQNPESSFRRAANRKSCPVKYTARLEITSEDEDDDDDERLLSSLIIVRACGLDSSSNC